MSNVSTPVPPVLTPAGQAGSLFAPLPTLTTAALSPVSPAQPAQPSQAYNWELALSNIRPNVPIPVIPILGSIIIIALANTMLYKGIVVLLIGMIVFWIAK